MPCTKFCSDHCIRIEESEARFPSNLSCDGGTVSETGPWAPGVISAISWNIFAMFTNYNCCLYCPACRTSLIATRFWVVVICPIIKCLTVLEFSFILFDLCLFITIFNFILNYVLIVTFWIFTYHKIWILLIIFCFFMKLLNYLFFNVFGSILECCELTGVSLLWPWLIKWK